jgi:hypothetical protein
MDADGATGLVAADAELLWPRPKVEVIYIINSIGYKYTMNEYTVSTRISGELAEQVEQLASALVGPQRGRARFPVFEAGGE